MSLNRDDLIEDVLGSNPTTIDDLHELPLYSIFISIGGYLALGLGLFHFIVSMTREPFLLLIGHLIVNICLGTVLLFSNHKIVERKILWGSIVVMISIMLIALGGIVGALSGILALIGGVLSLVDEHF